MDTRELTSALRDATEDLEPRAGFAEAVVVGGRRRRVRRRITVLTALAGTAAVVTAVVVAGPTTLTAPPSPGASTTPVPPKEDWRLAHSSGQHVHDAFRTTEILEAWASGLRGGRSGPANQDGRYDERPGDPHVFWAGETPYGEAAIVVERVVLGADEHILTGVVAAAPGDPRPRLLGAQVDDPGPMGYFMLPDDRTVIAVAEPGLGLWVSPEIHYDGEGSRREWFPVPAPDGVGIAQLPTGTNPLNVRLVAGDPDSPPRHADMRLGAHLPLVVTSTFPSPAPPQPIRRGLRWNGDVQAANLADIPVQVHMLAPLDHFTSAVRDSGLLDPSSYTAGQGSWVITGALTDVRMVVVSEKQELDHPAYLYATVIERDGRASTVERIGRADSSATLPVMYRLPHRHGWLVAAFGKPLSYRTSPSEDWSETAPDAAILPVDATQVRVGGQLVDLP